MDRGGLRGVEWQPKQKYNMKNWITIVEDEDPIVMAHIPITQVRLVIEAKDKIKIHLEKGPQQIDTNLKFFEDTRAKAEMGNARAQNDLGFCYHDGKGVTQDYAEAVR